MYKRQVHAEALNADAGQFDLAIDMIHDAGCKAAFWTVNTEDVVRSLVPLGPDCFVTDRSDVIREWIEKAQAET